MKRAVIVLSILFGIGAVLVIACFGYYFTVTRGVRLDAKKLTPEHSCVRIFDAAGNALPLPAQRAHVPLSQLPCALQDAFLCVEDRRFYRHNGLDYRRIVKATMKNLLSFSFREGASTISQQLIKNTHLSGEKTLRRKLKELKLTRILERNYSKQEILELYLNTIYFGHNAFGVERAAQFYFGKRAEELSVAECAMLAALVRAPNHYSPFRDAARCITRRDFVLARMRDAGAITQEEYRDAARTPLPEAPAEENNAGSSYLRRVFEELSLILPSAKASDMQELKIHTFYEPELQEVLESLPRESDVCLLVRSNETGGLRALHSTCGTPARLPASTIKPLLVYAPALEENLISPATPVLDEKTDFAGYSPKNYGGEYGGYMSVRYALSHSVNIPAVKILNELGIDRAASYLSRLGLDVPKEERSLALALGGMKRGFPLPALADAYAAFACEGVYSPSHAIRRIEDGSGRVLYRFEPKKRRVFSKDVVFLINDMLKTAAREGTAKRLKSLPFSICAKTGTGGGEAGNTDAYTITYTRDDTVAVWMGMRDNSPVQITGGGLPANFACKINKALYNNEPPREFTPCSDVEKVRFDRKEYEDNHRILLADPASPACEGLSDYFRKSALPKTVCERFSRPIIEKPRISTKNGGVCIELCQTEYYDYIIKRRCGKQEIVVYEGKYLQTICDHSVKSGTVYEYTVIPLYCGIEGEPVRLPAVCIEKSDALPPDWWQ